MIEDFTPIAEDQCFYCLDFLDYESDYKDDSGEYVICNDCASDQTIEE